MAEAYASLVSIMQILDQLQNHPRPPTSIHKDQLQSLTQIVTFLQDFLQDYNNHVGYSKQVDAIADAAHAVEDVIESHIVNQILADGEKISSVDLYEALQKVIDDMELMKREIMDMREKMGVVDSSTSTASSISVASSNSASVGQNQTMVGFDDILLEVLDELTNHKSSRQIISITGMGGIGKTTLARNVYEHDLVVQHFDFLAWLTISQQYNFGKILRKVLKENGENLSLLDENDLGYKLHQILSGRRYLIIIDDIWNIEVWDQLKLSFPDNNNGSRIMITTRLSNLARQIAVSHNIAISFMDEDNSWKLFCKLVFGKEECPLEIKEIAMNIVRGCKGLPLSISVVGGLLAKSNRAQQYWEHIAENLNSIVNLEDNEHCLQILYMSYNSLPVHLKPCFLYMGCFEEDEEIPIMFSIAMWVGEGFLRPIYGKSLEDAAREYVIELTDRNLLLFNEEDMSNSDWMFKLCKIHDLLRDLCLRESEKQKFLNVVGHRSLNISHNIRRISIAKATPEEEVLPIMESASLVRSLWWESKQENSLSSIGFRLLRVAVVNGINDLEDIVLQVNLRVIIILDVPKLCRITSSISRFWNLQTLVIINFDESPNIVIGPFQIWNMSQLRFIFVNRLSLPDPAADMPDCSIVLEKVHTIVMLYNFKCSEEVVKRIPHIKFFGICYVEVEGSSLADYCLNNLGHLQELEHLLIEVEMKSQIVQNLMITFPRSLKSLNLSGTTLHWDDVTTKIGSLPLLQHLLLEQDSCTGATWKTVEGQFCSLEFLKICWCGDLEYWMTNASHFPRLEHLYLKGLHKFYEIPSSIGDIPTLQSIEVEDCSDSACDSAKIIKEEQEELGNEDLQVQVRRSERFEGKDTLEDETEVEDNVEDEVKEAHTSEGEHHYLKDLHKLCEIPSSIEDIPTLQSIEVEDCSESVCDSVERIKDEQEELGNKDLQIQVRCSDRFKEEDTFDETEDEHNVQDGVEDGDTSHDEIRNED